MRVTIAAESTSRGGVRALTTLAALGLVVALAVVDAPEMDTLLLGSGALSVMAVFALTSGVMVRGAKVVCAVALGLACSFLLLWPALGSLQADDPQPIVGGVCLLLAVAAPIALPVLYVMKWRRAATPLLRIVLAASVGTIVFLAMVPSNCGDSIPPQCTTHVGIETTGDSVRPPIFGGSAAAALTWSLSLLAFPLRRPTQ
jgi:hypothetical protein